MHLAAVSERPCWTWGRASCCDWLCEQTVYLCVSVCGTHTVCHISSACLHVPFLLLCFGSKLPSPVPDVKASPSQVYISLVNLSVDAKTRADMSSRHYMLCTQRHCTKAIEEIYLLGGGGWATLLFSCKCLFLWDLAGFVGVNHGSLSHFTGGFLFCISLIQEVIGFSLGH